MGEYGQGQPHCDQGAVPRVNMSMDAMRIWFDYVALTTAYAAAVDGSDGERVADLFTSDGVWDATDYGLAVLRGREPLVAHFSQALDQVSVHLVANHAVQDTSGGTVEASSLAHAMIRRTDRFRQLVVRYDDRLVHDGDRWLFAARRLSRVVSS